jgi:predicted DNA-binding transcriptional regulator AlpA
MSLQSGATARKAASIEEFCQAHDLSRASFYNMRKSGIGPREMRVGARVLISDEAASDWRRERKQAAPKAGA